MISEQLIQSCRRMKREAQREVYELMGPKLYRTCKRYLKDEDQIEDILSDTFFFLFTKLDQLREDAAFEGWAIKTAVNLCLDHLRQKVNFNIYVEDSDLETANASQSDSGIREDDLLNLLKILPEGCRTVFSLYAIEGYTHKEISKQLFISESTSKSQLKVARTKLQNLVNAEYFRQAK